MEGRGLQKKVKKEERKQVRGDWGPAESEIARFLGPAGGIAKGERGTHFLQREGGKMVISIKKKRVGERKKH